jgi:cephalosporin hydroxylase
MNPHDNFGDEVRRNIEGLKADRDVQALSRIWMREITPYRYAYNFRWMGRPIIQFPQDMVAMQEILWTVRPDLVIETGIAHGGSILYYASLLEMIGHGEVLGIDVDIRPANREAIDAHPMRRRLRTIEGSSIAPDVVDQVRAIAHGKRAIVVLDSNHAHEHVLAELRAYAPLVCEGGYCVVMDTLIEDMPARFFEGGDRPWGVGNNPKTAVQAYLREDDRFAVDEDLEAKLLLTVAPGGWLRRTR